MTKMKIEGLEFYKQVLEENSDYLVEKLSLSPLFFASLLSKKVASSVELEDIEVSSVMREIFILFWCLYRPSFRLYHHDEKESKIMLLSDDCTYVF